ncbi:hypothetical protein JGU71_14015 [Antrihabitans sp. YC3-6]|uniref:Uncharacterized protein n=1 Tax=Antrihabitans stalagmiti TaxID=2799499 RepID=A0A934U4P5_9NOCA|nr:hypothetical protein [Antrihabitans stalagmiti]MBJ8340008.1 hypothetical protein [Antrihabitans stalagmiti]
MQDAIAPGRGHFDAAGNYYLPEGRGVLSQTGVYTDPHGAKIYGAAQFRISPDTGGLVPRVPIRDAADPQRIRSRCRRSSL